MYHKSRGTRKSATAVPSLGVPREPAVNSGARARFPAILMLSRGMPLHIQFRLYFYSKNLSSVSESVQFVCMVHKHIVVNHFEKIPEFRRTPENGLLCKNVHDNLAHRFFEERNSFPKVTRVFYFVVKRYRGKQNIASLLIFSLRHFKMFVQNVKSTQQKKLGHGRTWTNDHCHTKPFKPLYLLRRLRYTPQDTLQRPCKLFSCLV